MWLLHKHTQFQIFKLQAISVLKKYLSMFALSKRVYATTNDFFNYLVAEPYQPLSIPPTCGATLSQGAQRSVPSPLSPTEKA